LEDDVNYRRVIPMIVVDDFSTLKRSVEYKFKTQTKVLKDRVEYSIAEVAKTATQITEETEEAKNETIAEWVTRVTCGAKLFKRDGAELTAAEAVKDYDDMGGLVKAIFDAIVENERKNS
jgi:hypothetical protein